MLPGFTQVARSNGRRYTRQALLLGLVTAACGPKPSSEPVASPAVHAPDVAATVRHFAGQIARGDSLPTVASRRYGGDSLTGQAATDDFYLLQFPTCHVDVRLDKQQRIASVYLSAPWTAATADTLATSPTPGRLLRLGKLRRLFGPDQILPAMLTLQEAWRRYPVEFRYAPTGRHRQVSIHAMLRTPHYADTTMVHAISLYPEP